MENIISKELLSEVLGRPIEIISIDENRCEIRNSISFENYQLGVSYIYLYGNKETRFMPIHELAHKCILYAWDNFYEITPRVMGAEIMCLKTGYTIHTIYRKEIENPKKFDARYIYKACQWLLDNK